MKETKDDFFSLSELVNISKSFLGYLRKKMWLLLLAVLVGAALGVGYYYIQKPKYEAVTTFILEEKSAGSGGLAGLASQFGFNLGSLSGGGSIFTGDNILDILKSKKIVQKVLLSTAGNENPNSQTLADLYLEFTEIKKDWQKKSRLAGIKFAPHKQQLSPLQDSVLNVIYEKIIKKNLLVDRFNKKGSIIKVQVTAANEVFARLMTERLVEEAAKLYMDVRTGTSQENIRQLQRRSDSLLILLNRKSYAAAASQPLDINPALRTAVVPTEIANRDKAVLATLYAEVTKNLEASKLLLSQQTPVIQLLDRPGEALNDNKKGVVFFIVVSSLLCFIISVVAIGSVYYFKKVLFSNKGVELSK